MISHVDISNKWLKTKDKGEKIREKNLRGIQRKKTCTEEQ